MSQRRARFIRLCPTHKAEIANDGYCEKCRAIVPYWTRCFRIVDPSTLRPMRQKGQPTKRAIERRVKGYAR